MLDVVMMRWRTIATILLVTVLVIPAVTGTDDIPLSTYPMYANPRSSIVEFVVPVALDAGQVERDLSTTTIAETRDPLIAESFLRSEVAAGRVSELCQQIAMRITDEQVVSIEIRTERHRVVDRALGDPSLIDQQVVARCEASP